MRLKFNMKLKLIQNKIRAIVSNLVQNTWIIFFKLFRTNCSYNFTTSHLKVLLYFNYKTGN